MLNALHAAATLLMTGVVLCIAVVHYPLFDKVGREVWPAYEAAHVQRITWVVAPLMLAELALSVLLVVAALAGWGPPDTTARVLAFVGLALLAVVWGVTFFFSVPQHGKLAAGWDDATFAALLAFNWVRTIAWCLRSVLAVWLIAR